MPILLLLLALLLCPRPSLAGEPRLNSHGPRNQPQVALTFDLCQVPSRPAGFDRKLVEVLRQQQAPATFFVGGDWLRTHQAEGAELAAEKRFEFGNHSWSHPDLRRLDQAGIKHEIEATEKLLTERFGSSPHLLRLPFGYYSPAVLQAAEASGERVIQWDVVSGDPDRHLSREQLIRNATTGVRNGSIIIMHANGRGWQTAAALPDIITTLRRRGFELVTVSQLLDGPGN